MVTARRAGLSARALAAVVVVGAVLSFALGVSVGRAARPRVVTVAPGCSTPTAREVTPGALLVFCQGVQP